MLTLCKGEKSILLFDHYLNKFMVNKIDLAEFPLELYGAVGAYNCKFKLKYYLCLLDRQLFWVWPIKMCENTMIIDFDWSRWCAKMWN